jgi:hypothetical protein
MVPKHLQNLLEQRLVDCLAGSLPGESVRRVAAEKRAFLVYSDIGGAALLSVDGRVWELPWDDEDAYEATPQGRLCALVIGAERFPELQELLPIRPASTPNCLGCQGTGKFSNFDKVRCLQCSGLGWIP